MLTLSLQGVCANMHASYNLIVVSDTMWITAALSHIVPFCLLIVGATDSSYMQVDSSCACIYLQCHSIF